MTPSHPTGTEAVGLWTKLRVAHETIWNGSNNSKWTGKSGTLTFVFFLLLRLTFGLWIIRCHSWVFSFTVSLGVEASCIFVFILFISSCWIRKPNTLPETNSLHLKMDGWKRIFLLWPGLFSGAFAVSFRYGNLRAHRSTNQPMAWHPWPRCLLLQATLLQVAILEHIPPKPLQNSYTSCLTPRFSRVFFEYIRCCEKSLFLQVKLLSFSISDLFRDSAYLYLGQVWR